MQSAKTMICRNNKESYAILIVGSVGSGKTTLARTLPKMLVKRAPPNMVCTCTISMNICHFLCYFILYIIFKLKYFNNEKIIGNYYLTIHFTNKQLFSRIVKIMMLFDILSILLSYLKLIIFKLICCSKLYKVIIFDEYILNMLIDYMYFNLMYRFKNIYKMLYLIGYSTLITQLKNSLVLIVYMKIPLTASIKAWQKREKIIITDVFHLYERTLATERFIQILSTDKRIQAVIVRIQGRSSRETYTNALHIAFKFIRSCWV